MQEKRKFDSADTSDLLMRLSQFPIRKNQEALKTIDNMLIRRDKIWTKKHTPFSLRKQMLDDLDNKIDTE
ncbi:hypothetical protein Ciccas_014163, partial [Cichlidogyrus casuarinus]